MRRMEGHLVALAVQCSTKLDTASISEHKLTDTADVAVIQRLRKAMEVWEFS